MCDDYNSQDLVPTLLELGKSALIRGNIVYPHNNFQSFKETIPRSIQLAPVYPIHVSKAVNREDKRSRRYRDRDFAKFERSRRYRDR